MAAIEQYGGGGKGESLHLYYLHSANGNKGDGSVNNPFGNFDLLLNFLDTNPTIVGATIIVLGGHFETDRNIYRGSSFFFFSGTSIKYTGTDYLLEDTGTTQGHDGDFFFKGDVQIECTQGGFMNLGYYYANATRTLNRSKANYWEVEIASLYVWGYSLRDAYGDPIGQRIANALYGFINEYKITILKVSGNFQAFFQGSNSEYNLSIGADYANAGIRVGFFSDSLILPTISTLYDGTSQYIGRVILFKIKEITIGLGAAIYRGKVNRDRSSNIRFEIDILQSSVINSSSTYDLFQNISTVGNDFGVVFLLRNTWFVWNTAYNTDYPTISPIRIPLSTTNANIHIVCEGCKKPAPPWDRIFVTTDSLGMEAVQDLGGNVISNFNTLGAGLRNTIMNL